MVVAVVGDFVSFGAGERFGIGEIGASFAVWKSFFSQYENLQQPTLFMFDDLKCRESVEKFQLFGLLCLPTAVNEIDEILFYSLTVRFPGLVSEFTVFHQLDTQIRCATLSLTSIKSFIQFLIIIKFNKCEFIMNNLVFRLIVVS